MEFKERLEKILKNKQEQRELLNTKLIESDTKEERAAIGETLKSLGEEIADVQKLLEDADKPQDEQPNPEDEGQRMYSAGSKQMRNERNAEDSIYSSINYRKAFQNYMGTGNVAQINTVLKRDSTKTTDTNVATVIPDNLINDIFEKYEQLGTIYNLVTKTSYAVGQTIPVDGVKPTATWVGEGEGSTAQKKTLSAAISFVAHKLRCEVRLSQEVTTMTLSAFEALFVKQVGEAMLRAIEYAVVEGDGSGKPKGILVETAPDGQTISIATGAKQLTYKVLCDIEAAVPAQYESTAKWCMTKKTFMAFVGMTDTAGQPVARVDHGINGKPERYLLGREVVIYAPQAASKLGNYADTVTADTIVAFIADFGDYILNTNYNLGIQHAQDWDNEDHKTKAVLSCDGKLLTTDSLVIVKKLKASV